MTVGPDAGDVIVTLEKQLMFEVQILREEAKSLALGDMRNAVEEIAQRAEGLLAALRNEAAGHEKTVPILLKPAED